MFRFRPTSRRWSTPRLLPFLEQLETRTAPAGNVMAFVSSGNLIVIGDNQGDDITVSQPRVGAITLSGDGTSLNHSNGPLTFYGVARDLRIKLGNGDNTLTFDQTNPITVFGNLSISCGTGSNWITTLDGSTATLTVGRDLEILNQPGQTEAITLLNLNVYRNAVINDMGGDSIVSIDANSSVNSSAPVNFILGNLQIVNGPGQYNQTTITSTYVKSDLQIVNRGETAITNITSSTGPNTIGRNLQVIDGTGQLAQTTLDGTKVGGNLQVMASGSNPQSTLILTSTHVRKETSLLAGNASDQIYIGGDTFGGSFQLETGNGADSVLIGAGEYVITTVTVRILEETVFGNGTFTQIITPVVETIQAPYTLGAVAFNGKVSASLGQGDDFLSLAEGATVRFKKSAVFDGNGGYNTLNYLTSNLPARPIFKNFVATPVGCFVAGTLVATSFGLRPIEEIRSGDKVYAYDHESFEWVLAEVIEPLVHDYRGDLVTIVIGTDQIKATGNHPFWVVSGKNLTERPVSTHVPVHERPHTPEGRWVAARSLQPNDVLLRNNGQTVTLDKVTVTSSDKIVVHNLEVTSFHNYSVGYKGVLVHNAPAK